MAIYPDLPGPDALGSHRLSTEQWPVLGRVRVDEGGITMHAVSTSDTRREEEKVIIVSPVICTGIPH